MWAARKKANNRNCFSQTEEVWINETCLKAKIKASAWKTIRKTQYDNYEDYFQVFRGFSKKSYPEKLYLFVQFMYIAKENEMISVKIAQLSFLFLI